jgi:peptidoglycan/xylan/chitin deacetylase (PgdA/CDA1 family)
MLEVVMLHHVAAETTAHIGPRSKYVVTPAQLDDYLQSRQTWRPLSGKSNLRHGSAERCFLITFDDGYRNNLTEALPVLEAHDVPCVLFVTTGFVDGTVYPYELELASVAETLTTVHLLNGSTVEVDSDSDRWALYQRFREPLKSATHTHRERFLDELACRNGYLREDFQRESMLTWKDLKELSQHPLVTIGAHTCTHLLLSSQWWGTAFQEIRHSRDELESRLGHRISVISYPYGGHSFAVRRFVQALGFEYAFTTEPRRTRQVGRHNYLSIPRIDINQFTRA